ncbi:CoA transferase [Glutamicibacter ectropisis]|uniref:CoA transferase n=1 Tax=Glutamicibacter ectropisis TaxID=3046593 RepID=A0AAU6WH25_9MICC
MGIAESANEIVKRTLGTGFTQSGVLELSQAPRIRGPQSWWGGPLAVEQLALGSVGLVATALHELSDGSIDVEIDSSQVAAAFNSSSLLEINGEKSAGFAEHSGFYRTSDGWIRTHANYPHHERALLQATGTTPGADLAKELKQYTVVQAQEIIVDAGGIATAVQTREQWLQSEAGQAAQRGEWAQFSLRAPGEGRVWNFNPRAPRALEGLRVLDLTRVIAGPTATKTLAAFGAQVLRIDAPQLPELREQHIDTGFGKRSALLDFSSATDAQRMTGLLEQADVVIIGYRHGALSSFGLGRQSLSEKYPNLIIAELDAWGYTGPWANRRGFDSIVQAACGIADAYGTEDGVPGALPVQALDHATGYGLAAAIIAMVRARAERQAVGSVRFSLARTAQALFDFGTPALPTENLDAPRMGQMDSSYGTLNYAQSPFICEGQGLDFASAPPPYGEDEPIWL